MFRNSWRSKAKTYASHTVAIQATLEITETFKIARMLCPDVAEIRRSTDNLDSEGKVPCCAIRVRDGPGYISTLNIIRLCNALS